MPLPAAAPAPRTAALSVQETTQLWKQVLYRLKGGEALLTDGQFLRALEDEYASLKGEPADTAVRLELCRSVVAVHRDFPESFRGVGLQNRLDRAFEAGARQLRWDADTIQEAGVRSIYRFRRQDKVRALLHTWRVTSAIDPYACINRTLDVFKPTGDPVLPAMTPRQRAHLEEAVADGALDHVETATYLCHQDEARQTLETQERARALDRLQVYVEEGLLTPEEARHYRQLREIEQQEKEKKIDRRRAAEMRTQVLSRERRKLLDYKVKSALSLALDYLQAFDGLKRIGQAFDETLAYLVQHKGFVSARRDADDADLALTTLRYNRGIMTRICDIMERREQEIRFLAVRLPPYKAVTSGHTERLPRLTVEPEFVADLRALSLEEMSERLNSESSETRSRAAADIRSFVHLIEQVIRPTPFRKQVRLVRFGQLLAEQAPTLEGLYSGASDLGAGRRRARMYVGRSARRAFNDLSKTELAALAKSAEDFLLETEVKLLRRQAADAAGAPLFDRGKKGDAVAPVFNGATPEAEAEGAEPVLNEKTGAPPSGEAPAKSKAPKTGPKPPQAAVTQAPGQSADKQTNGAPPAKDPEPAAGGRPPARRRPKPPQESVTAVPTKADGAEPDFGDMPLLNEPVDVQVVRVRVRAGSGYREMRAKIMPDPERPGQYVIAGRNPQTGELVPQTQRGQKRVVEKAPRGVWRIVSESA